jgi:hypothetical protein
MKAWPVILYLEKTRKTHSLMRAYGMGDVIQKGFEGYY